MCESPTTRRIALDRGLSCAGRGSMGCSPSIPVTGLPVVRFLVIFGFFLLALAACDDEDAPNLASTGLYYEAGAPTGSCAAVEQQHSIEGALHVTECSAVAYGTNPPSSGNHYGLWAAFKVYTNPIPPGYWVHDLEHGGVVITYSCEDGCGGEVAAAEEMLNSLPTDLLCLQTATVPRRTIMTPDPRLDVPFAASAWGFTLRANCFDAEAFRSF